jgi:hypothetical protein
MNTTTTEACPRFACKLEAGHDGDCDFREPASSKGATFLPCAASYDGDYWANELERWENRLLSTLASHEFKEILAGTVAYLRRPRDLSSGSMRVSNRATGSRTVSREEYSQLYGAYEDEFFRAEKLAKELAEMRSVTLSEVLAQWDRLYNDDFDLWLNDALEKAKGCGAFEAEGQRITTKEETK